MNRKIKVLFILLLQVILCIGCSSEANLVIGTVSIDDLNGILVYPEIVVDNNGNWKQATKKAIWEGQVFQVLDIYSNKYVGSMRVIDDDNIPADSDFEQMIDLKRIYFAISSTKEKFEFRGIKEASRPKIVKEEATNILLKSYKNNRDKLIEVVEIDGEYINDDLPRTIELLLYEYLVGDVNGDQRKDYVLLLAEDNFKRPGGQGAVVVVYLAGENSYERIVVDFWEETSDSSGWPRLLLMHDFNGDNSEELFIVITDADSNLPIVYSWFSDGIKKVYEANDVMWFY